MSIITLGCGAWGGSVMAGFFGEIAKEHNIITGRSQNQLEYLDYKDAYFKNSNKPRAIFFDFQENSTGLNAIKGIPTGFDAENIFSLNDNSNGLYTSGRNKSQNLVSDILERFRKEVEGVDKLEAIQLFAKADYSCGIAGAVITKLKEEFMDYPMITHLSLSSSKKTDNSFNNCFLTFDSLENADFTTIVDDEQSNLKALVSCYSDISSPGRATGQRPGGFRRYVFGNPFCRLHFYNISYSPQGSVEGLYEKSCLVGNNAGLDEKSLISSITIFRGTSSPFINEKFLSTKKSLSTSCLSAFSYSFYTDLQNASSQNSAVGLFSHGNIWKQYTNLLEECNPAQEEYESRMKEDNYDYMSFVETSSNFNDLVSEYYQYANPSS